MRVVSLKVRCNECGEWFEYEVSEEILDEYENDLDIFLKKHTFVCGECSQVMCMNEDERFEEFRNILREELTDEQWVKFVIDWFNADYLCEMIEDSFVNSDKKQQEEWLKLIKKYRDRKVDKR